MLKQKECTSTNSVTLLVSMTKAILLKLKLCVVTVRRPSPIPLLVWPLLWQTAETYSTILLSLLEMLIRWIPDTSIPTIYQLILSSICSKTQPKSMLLNKLFISQNLNHSVKLTLPWAPPSLTETRILLTFIQTFLRKAFKFCLTSDSLIWRMACVKPMSGRNKSNFQVRKNTT